MSKHTVAQVVLKIRISPYPWWWPQHAQHPKDCSRMNARCFHPWQSPSRKTKPNQLAIAFWQKTRPKSQNSLSPLQNHANSSFLETFLMHPAEVSVSEEGAGLCALPISSFQKLKHLGMCQLPQSIFLHISCVCRAPITAVIHTHMQLLSILSQTGSLDCLLL